MKRIRRFAAVLIVPLTLVIAAAAPAAAADDGVVRTGDDNTAVAVNTEDGGSVFRLAFSIRKVADGVVDQTNTAQALASCTDCQTVALAFQIVLVSGDVDVVVPENGAVAYNDGCVACLTYASATQIVLGFDGPVRFTAEGRQRLAALQQSLRSLEERISTLSAAQLHAEVSAAKAELAAILNDELVEPGPADPAAADSDAAASTTTTTSPGPTTSEDTSSSTTGPTASTVDSPTTSTTGTPTSTTTTSTSSTTTSTSATTTTTAVAG